MVPLLVAVVGVLTLAVLALGFLLLGLMWKIQILDWRFEHFLATTPRRFHRDGLNAGTIAPDFTLPTLDGAERSLHDFLGRDLLLVFVQTGCAPCHKLLPALKRFNNEGLQVLVVNNGSREQADAILKKNVSSYPVLFQTASAVSKRYQIVSFPFAFIINESGRVAAKGYVNTAQHVQFLLGDAERYKNKAVSTADGVESLAIDSQSPEVELESHLAASHA